MDLLSPNHYLFIYLGISRDRKGTGPFVNERYTEGLPSVSKMIYIYNKNKDKGLDLEVKPPWIKLCRVVASPG